MPSVNEKPLVFEGHRNLRKRLVLATLAGKTVKIVKIRSNHIDPGLKDYEVSFLRLLEAVTNGTQIEISYTGTSVIYKPGIIIGGEVTHQCPNTKPIGYFLEPLVYLAPFSKKKFSIILRGLTALDRTSDAGIEAIKWGMLPLMEKFGVRECAVHILKRGSPPLGGGEVHFFCNSLITLPLTFHALDSTKVSAIRGVAYCTRVSPSTANRIIDSARKVLRPTNVEVNITADVWRGDNSGKSPGFGVTLVAELKKGWRIFSEGVGSLGTLPEDLGERVAYELLEELSKSCVVGRNQLPLCLAFMALGKEDVGRLKIHKEQVDENLIWFLRDLKDIFGAEAFIRDMGVEAVDSSDVNHMMLSMKGVGFTSAAKKAV